jgi:transcriptional regulator with GAF, ATPase, and Fis domain
MKNISTLADFCESTNRCDSFEVVGQKCIEFVSDFFHPVYSSFMLFDIQSHVLLFEKLSGFVFERATLPRIEISDDIVTSISKGGEILALPDQQSQKFLVLFDPDQLNKCELRIPFFVIDHLIGILSIGKKQSGTDYTTSDIDLLRMIIHSVATRCHIIDLIECHTTGSSHGRMMSSDKLQPQSKQTELQPHITFKNRADYTELLGESPAMNHIKELIPRIAREDVPVLITGESGTGKELVARAIHLQSRRADKPLVAMNCAALPDTLVESELFGHEKGAFTGAYTQKKGKFEYAHESTLILDEIGDMDLSTQSKLLRVLQDGTFQRIGSNRTLFSNARVIAATNQNLVELIRNGKFREDLFYRINVLQIDVPPLRRRQADIVLLARYFFDYYNGYYRRHLAGFHSEVLNWMSRYRFPGNVRELKNIIERAVIMSTDSTITMDLMPVALSSSKEQTPATLGKNMTLEELEKRHIRSVMEQTHFNKSAAARMLGIARKTLREKLQKYQIVSK